MTGLTAMAPDLLQEAKAAKPPKPPKTKALSHIPGNIGLPFIGNTLDLLYDPARFMSKRRALHGNVFRNSVFGFDQVCLIGPKANELLLHDRDGLFSSEGGWGPVLGRLFPRGLLLLDFEEHKLHRKIMNFAFKTAAMRTYLEALNAGISTQVDQWSTQKSLRFYPEIKALTLNLAAPCFLGLPWGPEINAINKAFFDLVAASAAPIRVPIPGTMMHKGVRGRAFMCEIFAREIPKRRTEGGSDMFSQLCQASDETGRMFSDQEIIDHMVLMMMAAHDTITSTLTTLVWQLGLNPFWQSQLRLEIDTLGLDGAPLAYEQLSALPLVEMAVKEALRLNPPVPSIPRQAMRDFEFEGYTIPAGTYLAINPVLVHRDPELWPDPLKFDPLRFSESNSKARPKYAWIPFGGGAHTCIGLHFAMMQAKVFLVHLLSRTQIKLAPGAGTRWQQWPIPKPKDGLPLRFVPRS
jgi:cytochrome P450